MKLRFKRYQIWIISVLLLFVSLFAGACGSINMSSNFAGGGADSASKDDVFKDEDGNYVWPDSDSFALLALVPAPPGKIEEITYSPYTRTEIATLSGITPEESKDYALTVQTHGFVNNVSEKEGEDEYFFTANKKNFYLLSIEYGQGDMEIKISIPYG